MRRRPKPFGKKHLSVAGDIVERSETAHENVREQILSAAADCFMAFGFKAASIDNVAQRLGATKGMIYHYYRSKADLFFDVHRRGMEINLMAIEPLATKGIEPEIKLRQMCQAHLANMIQHLNFQRVVMQGVEMHLAGSTTPAQREKLAVLMREREDYEELFRKVLLEGRAKGKFQFDNDSFASKAVLAILNNPVLWYRKRAEDDENSRDAIIREFTRFALQSVGVSTP